jgi:hypothetical protein
MIADIVSAFANLEYPALLECDPDRTLLELLSDRIKNSNARQIYS